MEDFRIFSERIMEHDCILLSIHKESSNLMKEIEYKYLVDKKKWNQVKKPKPQKIIQGFLCISEEVVVRVRIIDQQGFLTVKGKSSGIERSEFEYPIPLDEAKSMLEEFTQKQIIKNRFKIFIEDNLWEVDEFKGALEGLILAELEVENKEYKFTLPDWAAEDVSTNPDFFNAVLIEKC